MSTPLARLNFHHLHYFWAVAKEGNLTRAAKRLNVAQSALSTQIRQLEGQLGQPLFVREGRALALTEAGRIALAYAETIMTAGTEWGATLRDGLRQERQVLRIGAVSTLSRNFQRAFVAPLFDVPDVSLVLQSGSQSDLLTRLRAHSLDLVLSNRRVHDDAEHTWRCVRVARQQVALVGHRSRRKFRFPGDLANAPMLLPSLESEVRSAFDLMCEQYQVRPLIVAEVDDMAMLRLLARDLQAIALVPAVVVRDELRTGRLHEYCAVPDLYEEFFAISVRRQYQHPLLRALLDRPPTAVLDTSKPA
jgi:LysR family transcriptional activator of nhaA